MVDYQGKKIFIIGLGLTGLSCVYFFLKRGVTPRIMDTRFYPPGLKKLPKTVDCYLGKINNKLLTSSDLIVLSPGIDIAHPALSAAVNAGIEIIGDIELFCREAKAPIIAITGSNGKSTVTTLVGEMAKTAGVNVGVGGNIGVPALSLLNTNTTYELYVLEISSFQLETTFSLQAAVATILNITEDHMDRYSFSFQQYSAAKLRIYDNAKICIANADDELTIPVSLSSTDNNNSYISFGVYIGDYHLNSKYGNTWLCRKGEKLLNIKDIKIYGQHNYINSLAAIAIADAIGLPRISSLKALTKFTGLAHNLQLALEQNGVRWINNSKSTNVSSTEAALNVFKIDGTRKLHLLLGGYSKYADFTALKRYLLGDNILIYCFGNDRNKIAALRPDIAELTETMEQSMVLIATRVQPGDIVLLSPACSSIDQFNNFEHRGEVFTSLAKELA